MDRMIFTQQRLQEENEQMKKKHKEILDRFQTEFEEKKRLIKTCEQQIEIVEKLTSECEKQKDLTEYLMEIKRSHEVARRMTKDNRREMQELKDRIIQLENHIEALNVDRQNLKCEAIYNIREFDRISNIIKAVRFTVKSAISGESDANDSTFRESQRKNLLTDLLNILNDLEKKTQKVPLETVPSIGSIYDHGDLGFTRKPSLEISETSRQASPQKFLEVGEEKSKTSSTESIVEVLPVLTTEIEATTSDPVLLDIVSGTTLYKTESELSSVPEGEKQDLKDAFEKPKEISESRTSEKSEKKMLSIDLQASFEQKTEGSDDGMLEGEREELDEEEVIPEEEEAFE
jgi:hypothetical protein